VNSSPNWSPPDIVHRLSDLVSGAENRYAMDADSIRSSGAGCPTLAVAETDGTRRIAELARDGRPLLVDHTGRGVVAPAVADIEDQLTVTAGRPVGDVSATAVLVRPDGYVAWASSADTPDIEELRRVLTHWFGI
jgi:hypothetical protein